MSQSTQLFLACRDCGQIHSVSNRLPTDRWLLCRRCGRRLWRSPRGALDRSAAYVAAAMILFGSANGLTLFEITFVGDHRNGMIISGVIQLTRYSTGISGVGVLVALTSIIIPALTLALTFSVLARLISVGRDNPRFRPTLAAAWKLARHLRPWSMLDVYLLGAAVAYSRLRRLADVAIGAGGYALAALVFVQVLFGGR
jgi:paraquat-inducible protein A